MGESNAARRIEGEANLAKRMAQERELRGWSRAELARRMTHAGCPDMPTNAVYRIERGERGISVNELVAMSRVFELSVSDLLVSVAWLRQERADKLLAELRESHDYVRHFATHKLELILAIVDLGSEGGEAARDALDFIIAHGSQWYESGDGKPLFAVQHDDGSPAEVDDRILREALVNLDFAIFAQAAEVLNAGTEDRDG